MGEEQELKTFEVTFCVTVEAVDEDEAVNMAISDGAGFGFDVIDVVEV